jgi:hypothetical protein
MKEESFIPKTCEECINSKYKLEKPSCAYEQGMEHKRAYTYFKKTYSISLQQHLDAMAAMKKQKEECLEKIKNQASKMIALRKALDIDSILGKIIDLNGRIDEIENGETIEKIIEDRDRILKPPKEEPDEYERKIVKREQPKQTHYERKPEKKEKTKKAIPLKDRGWLMYVRNTKKENVERYVNQLKREQPELDDSQIKISVNAAGNYMIRYTLNQEIA